MQSDRGQSRKGRIAGSARTAAPADPQARQSMLTFHIRGALFGGTSRLMPSRVA